MKAQEFRKLIREEVRKVLKEATNLLNIPEEEQDDYENTIGEEIGKHGPYVWVRVDRLFDDDTIKVHFDDIVHNKVTLEYEAQTRIRGYGANQTVHKNTEVIKINPNIFNN